MKQIFLYLGMLAGFVVPFCNIPLILKIRRHRSSKGISLAWAVGVFICTLLMLPQALLSSDISYKIFGVTNAILFALAFFHVVYYRRGG